jgi:RNA recognition motif-containing protein
VDVKLYIGNMIYDSSEKQLRKMTPKPGTVVAMGVVKDHVTGSPEGFAFITTNSQAKSTKPITAFNGKGLGGCPLTSITATQREERGGFYNGPKHRRRIASLNRE